MEDYVEKARKVMKELSANKNNQGEVQMVTTSQIRKFLTAVNTVSGKVDMVRNQNHGSLTILPKDVQAEVKFLQVKLAYQVGRNAPKKKWERNLVQDFVDKADLMNELRGIGDSVEKYEDFAHYVEALVAFHKYYGGKEK